LDTPEDIEQMLKAYKYAEDRNIVAQRIQQSAAEEKQK
jgi:hypothetical protein